jgi:hypothetical protein
MFIIGVNVAIFIRKGNPYQMTLTILGLLISILTIKFRNRLSYNLIQILSLVMFSILILILIKLVEIDNDDDI